MAANRRYSQDNVLVTTYNSCDEKMKERFKLWALSLEPDKDGGEFGADEDGNPHPKSAYLWVLHHNATPAFTDTSVYQTFIFFDAANGDVLGTGSFVPDDRDVGKTYGINGLGFWGFVNVRRELRGQGLGALISEFMDSHVQEFINEIGTTSAVSLFTANPIAVKIYDKLGFKFQKTIYIAEFEGNEDLHTKRYEPSSR